MTLEGDTGTSKELMLFLYLVDLQVFRLLLFLIDANAFCTSPLCDLVYGENNYIIQGHTHEKIELLIRFPS